MTGARRDLEAELQEQAGAFPPAWNPSPGETLVGVIRSYGEAQGKYGPCRTAVIQRDEGAKVSLWIASTVLLDAFRKAKPKVGERIGIRYLGKHPEKGYNRFALVVDRPETETDFAPLGGEEPAQASEPS